LAAQGLTMGDSSEINQKGIFNIPVGKFVLDFRIRNLLIPTKFPKEMPKSRMMKCSRKRKEIQDYILNKNLRFNFINVFLL
ncbi:unnamed protein product, partial [Allacma fusca]